MDGPFRRLPSYQPGVTSRDRRDVDACLHHRSANRLYGPWRSARPPGRPVSAPTAVGSGRRRVRVWFGPHSIADYTGNDAAADRYAAAMRRRFAGLRVTNEPLSPMRVEQP